MQMMPAVSVSVCFRTPRRGSLLPQGRFLHTPMALYLDTCPFCPCALAGLGGEFRTLQGRLAKCQRIHSFPGSSLPSAVGGVNAPCLAFLGGPVCPSQVTSNG